MAFNGFGTFNRLYNWVADKNAGVRIRADRVDEEMDGMADGLSKCITKDGQTTITHNIPLNGKKITNLGDATGDADALNRQTGDGRYPQKSNNLSDLENSATALSNLGVPKNIYDATSAPTVNHDTTQGYSKGSEILVSSNNELWICFDATEGAAEWRKVSGTFAGLDELPDNSVTSEKLADNIRISGTFCIGDSYPVYVYRTSGGADTSWKNIADITVNTGAYAAVSLQVEVINPHSNFGSKVDLDRHIFTVSARRSGATQDSYNDGLIAGPYADWVRLVKTATGVYQLQARQYANSKHIEFSCKVTSLLKANVSYNKSPSNGSTTGNIYTVTEPDPYHGSRIDKTRIPLKYMKFEGTNGYIHYETGFATLTRTGTGRYTCTFDAPEPDTNYEVWCDLECGTHALPFRFDARARNYTTTGFEIVVGEQNEGSWSYKDELVFVQVYRRA